MKKQEEFEEKLKFKNQFKPLDEDDVEYLVGSIFWGRWTDYWLRAKGCRIRS